MTDTLEELTDFEQKLCEHHLHLERGAPRVLQINVGWLCNLSCIHCHVTAGPTRKEIMTRETVYRILDWYDDNPMEVVDLTGGAPEMNPSFRYMVTEFKKRHAHVMDRCNLTILLQAGYEGTAEFLAEHHVEIVASMPCYSAENVNAQRGNGVFDQSIEALQLLNRIGYGIRDDLKLDLVYNPNGAFLPPDQEALEADYKRELRAHFGIEFHRLYALTNLPVARFANYLRNRGKYEDYMALLIDNFNPGSVAGLMCRDTVSVDWQGAVYDCDFNQQMNMHLGPPAPVGCGYPPLEANPHPHGSPLLRLHRRSGLKLRRNSESPFHSTGKSSQFSPIPVMGYCFQSRQASVLPTCFKKSLALL